MLKTTVILGASGVVFLVLAGCSHTTTREVVTPVPTATAAPPTVVVANTPPPAPRDEAPTPSPGAGYVWQGGHWTFRNGQYEWMPGHWEAPVIR